MKRSMVAALAAGSLMIAAGAAGAAGGGSAVTGGTVLVLEEDLTRLAPGSNSSSCDDVSTAWCVSTAATATATIQTAPGASPAVALRMTTLSESGKVGVFNEELSGTPLSDLNLLAFDALVAEQGSTSQQAPVLLIEVRSAQGPATLVWEMAESAAPSLTIGKWQTYRPSAATGWWSRQNQVPRQPSVSPAPGATPPVAVTEPGLRQAERGDGPGTLGFTNYAANFAQVKEGMPTAVVTRVGLGQGTFNAGLDAFVDRLVVNETVFDFDMAAETISVHESDFCTDASQWCSDERAAGSVSGVDDEQGLGGSVMELRTPGSDSVARLAATPTVDVALSEIRLLSYRTRTMFSVPMSDLTAALFFDVETATSTVTLIWEPVYGSGGRAGVVEREWQSWTPSTGPGWWSPQNFEGELAFDQYAASLADVQTALPDARVVRFGVTQGSGNPGLVARVDGLRVNETLSDFVKSTPAELQQQVADVLASASPAADPVSPPVVTPAALPTGSPEPSSSASTSPTPAASEMASPSASPTPAQVDPQAEVTEVAAQVQATAEPVVKALGNQLPGDGGSSSPSPTSNPSASTSPSSSPTTTSSPQPTQTATQPSTGGGNGESTTPSSSTPATPSPSASSVTPTPTPSMTNSPSASPSESPQPAPEACRTATIALDQDTIIATGSAGVTWTAAPGSTALLYAYSQPSTSYQVVRRVVTDASGTARTEVRPGTNTRLFALQDGCDQASFASESVVLNVRTALSLFAKRNAPQDYTFSGDSLPARPRGLIVSLYRVTDSGRQVLTSQARASSTNGDWTVRRTFTGTGRFGFVVRTGQDLQSAPGTSNVRSTLVF